MLEDNSSSYEETGSELSSEDAGKKTSVDKTEKGIDYYDLHNFKSSHRIRHDLWFPTNVGKYHQTFEVRMVLSSNNLKSNRSLKHSERSDMTKKPDDDVNTCQLKKNGGVEFCPICFRTIGRCFCNEALSQSKTSSSYQKKQWCTVYNPSKKLFECGCPSRRPVTADNNMDSIALTRKISKTPQATVNTSSIRIKCGCKSLKKTFDYNPPLTTNVSEEVPFVQTLMGNNQTETLKNRRCHFCGQSLAKCTCGNKKYRPVVTCTHCGKPIISCLCSKTKPSRPKCSCENRGEKMGEIKDDKKVTIPERPKPKLSHSFVKKPKKVKSAIKSDETVESIKTKAVENEKSGNENKSMKIVKQAKTRRSEEDHDKEVENKLKANESKREKEKETVENKLKANERKREKERETVENELKANDTIYEKKEETVENKLEANETIFEKKEETVENKLEANETKFEKKEEIVENKLEANETIFEKKEETVENKLEANETKFEKKEETVENKLEANETLFEKKEETVENKLKANESKREKEKETAENKSKANERKREKERETVENKSKANERKREKERETVENELKANETIDEKIEETVENKLVANETIFEKKEETVENKSKANESKRVKEKETAENKSKANERKREKERETVENKSKANERKREKERESEENKLKGNETIDEKKEETVEKKLEANETIFEKKEETVENNLKANETIQEKKKETNENKYSNDRGIDKKDENWNETTITTTENKKEDENDTAIIITENNRENDGNTLESKNKIEDIVVEDQNDLNVTNVEEPSTGGQSSKSKVILPSTEMKQKEKTDVNVLSLEDTSEPELLKFIEKENENDGENVKKNEKSPSITGNEVFEQIEAPKIVRDLQSANISRKGGNKDKYVYTGIPVQEKRFEKIFSAPPTMMARPRTGYGKKRTEKPSNTELGATLTVYRMSEDEKASDGGDSPKTKIKKLNSLNYEDGEIIDVLPVGERSEIKREKSISGKVHSIGEEIGRDEHIAQKNNNAESSRLKLSKENSSLEEKNIRKVNRNKEITKEQSFTSKLDKEDFLVDEKDRETGKKGMDISGDKSTVKFDIDEQNTIDEREHKENFDETQLTVQNKQEENQRSAFSRINLFHNFQRHTQICVEISNDKDSPLIRDKIDNEGSEFKRLTIEILDKEKVQIDKDIAEDKRINSCISESKVGYKLLNADSPDEIFQLMKNNGVELESPIDSRPLKGEDEKDRLHQEESVQTQLRACRLCNLTNRNCSKIPIHKMRRNQANGRICHCSTNTSRIESLNRGQQCQIGKGDSSETFYEAKLDAGTDGNTFTQDQSSEPFCSEKDSDELDASSKNWKCCLKFCPRHNNNRKIKVKENDLNEKKSTAHEESVIQICHPCKEYMTMNFQEYPSFVHYKNEKKCFCEANVNTDFQEMVTTGQQCRNFSQPETGVRCEESQTGGTIEQDVIASYVAICSFESPSPSKEQFMIQTLISQFAGDELGNNHSPSGGSLKGQNAMRSIQIQTGFSCASRCEAAQTVTTLVVTNADNKIEAAEGLINTICGPNIPGLRSKVSMNLNRLPPAEEEDDCVCNPSCPIQEESLKKYKSSASPDRTEIGTNMSYEIRTKTKVVFIQVSSAQTDPCESNICVLRDTPAEMVQTEEGYETTSIHANKKSNIRFNFTQDENEQNKMNLKKEQDEIRNEGSATPPTFYPDDPVYIQEPLGKVKNTQCVPETCEFFKSKRNLNCRLVDAATGPCGFELCPYQEEVLNCQLKSVGISISNTKSQVTQVETCPSSTVQKDTNIRYCSAIQTECMYQTPNSIGIILRFPCNVETSTEEPKVTPKAEVRDEQVGTNECPKVTTASQTCPVIKEEVERTVTTTVIYKYCDGWCNPFGDDTELEEASLEMSRSCDPELIVLKECNDTTCPDILKISAEEKDVSAMPFKKDICHVPTCPMKVNTQLDKQDVFKLEKAMDRFINVKPKSNDDS